MIEPRVRFSSMYAFYEQRAPAAHLSIGLSPAESHEHIRNVEERHCKIKRARRPDASTGWWALTIKARLDG